MHSTATSIVGLLALVTGACSFHIATPIPGLASTRRASPAHSALKMVFGELIGVDFKLVGVDLDVDSPLKKIILNTGDSVAEIHPFGACVTSYKVGGHDYLFIRPDAKMDGSKPISGGMPHCFPQFGPGEIQQHGFARNMQWDLVDGAGGDAPTVTLKLVDNEETMAMWPHPFEALYKVTLAQDKLTTMLTVKNTGSMPMKFQAALHSYFSCSDINKVTIQNPNFNGASYLNKMETPPIMETQEGSEIKITKETDSVYMDVDGETVISDAGNGKTLTVSSEVNWKDTVVWNPYGNKDMGADNFVCVESALVGKPKELTKGNDWVAIVDLIPGRAD